MEYLRKQDYDVTFCDKTEALLSKAFDKMMMKTVELREPLSTLCHGDIEQYSLQDGNERETTSCDVDFTFYRYSTPVIDLSTYLCLCCSNEVRKDKFIEIMRVYHDSLKEYLLEAGVLDIEKYSYEAR